MLIYDIITHNLKIAVDKIYNHLLKHISLISELLSRECHGAIHHLHQSKSKYHQISQYLLFLWLCLIL